MSQIPGNWKQCATCAYWSGARSTDTYNQHVLVNNACDYGKCVIPSGGWKGSQRQGSGSACRDYQKWPVLK